MLVGFLILAVGLGVMVTGRTARENLTTIAECQNDQNDIYFLLDSSYSVARHAFERQKMFVASLVEKLDITPHATRVGLGIFGDEFHGQFDLDDFIDKSSLVQAIMAVPYNSNWSSGVTYTGKALRGMRTRGFRGGVVREDVTKIGLTITDSTLRQRTSIIEEATRLSDMGVWLYVIGVGRHLLHSELSFSSQPFAEFRRRVPTFDDLSGLTNELASGACRLELPDTGSASCGRQQRTDILFLYDAAAMGREAVTSVHNFTENAIQAFSMTTGHVRVGVITEGRQGRDIGLLEYIRKQDFIRALKHDGPRSNLAALLKKAERSGFDPYLGGRYNANKFVIVFVDDVSAVSGEALYQALLMKLNDVSIYVIEVGLTGAREARGKVRTLASSPAYVSEFPSHEQLRDEEMQRRFIANLCQYV